MFGRYFGRLDSFYLLIIIFKFDVLRRHSKVNFNDC